MKPSLERKIQLGFPVALATVVAAGAAMLRSDPSRGTTVFFTLPASSEA